MGFEFKRPMKTVQESKGTQLCHKDNFECVASYFRGTQGKPLCAHGANCESCIAHKKEIILNTYLQ